MAEAKTHTQRNRMPVGQRRQLILTYIKTYQEENHGATPSRRQIAEATGLRGGAGTLQTYHLAPLRELGYIDYDDHTARTIRVIKDSYNDGDNELVKIQPYLRQSLREPYKWNGKWYDSMAEAEKATGISVYELAEYLIRGLSSDEEVAIDDAKQEAARIWAARWRPQYGTDSAHRVEQSRKSISKIIKRYRNKQEE